MHITIGCPVKNRAWILPQWFEAICRACDVAEVERSFIFLVGAGDEDFDVLKKLCENERHLIWEVLDDPPVTSAHGWGTPGRIEHMVILRNMLLGLVRKWAPDLFFSADSDILLHPSTLKNLLESLERFDAVGGKAYMTLRGVGCPSYGIWERGMYRSDQDGVFSVDVIMALKLMKPVAYNIDYSYSHLGEDIGWSKNAKDQGLKLGWDGRIANKHVLDPDLINDYDERCGY